MATLQQDVVGGWHDAINDLQHYGYLVTGKREFGDPEYDVIPGVTRRWMVTLFIFCCGFAVVFLVYKKGVYPLIADLVGLPKDTRSQVDLRTKFELALREFLFYSFSTVTHVAFYAWRYDWMFPAHYHTHYDPVWSGDATASGEMRVTYLFELTWYIAGVVLLILDFRRKDFLPMLIHHFATIFLVIGSWHTGYTRTGVVVIFLHNIADVFLQGAKLVNYCKVPVIDEVLFVAFAASFGFLRLFWFPQLVWQAMRLIPFWVPNAGPDAHPVTLGSYLWMGLLVLVVLHVYWFGLIVKMAINKLQSGETMEDIREAEGGDGVGNAKQSNTKGGSGLRNRKTGKQNGGQ